MIESSVCSPIGALQGPSPAEVQPPIRPITALHSVFISGLLQCRNRVSALHPPHRILAGVRLKPQRFYNPSRNCSLPAPDYTRAIPERPQWPPATRVVLCTLRNPPSRGVIKRAEHAADILSTDCARPAPANARAVAFNSIKTDPLAPPTPAQRQITCTRIHYAPSARSAITDFLYRPDMLSIQPLQNGCCLLSLK